MIYGSLPTRNASGPLGEIRDRDQGHWQQSVGSGVANRLRAPKSEGRPCRPPASLKVSRFSECRPTAWRPSLPMSPRQKQPVVPQNASYLADLISDSFSIRDSAFMAASRFNARLRLVRTSSYTRRIGRRLRVYREAAPALCWSHRRLKSVVMPVYNESSAHRSM